MSVLARLDQWRNAGAISGAQHDAIAALARKDRFSVFIELNALLYLGVLAFAAGAGWTIATYSERLGDVVILSALTCASAAALSYCVTRGLPYARGRVEHPGIALDYVLYLGCLLFALDLGYAEARYHPFGAAWDHSLLLASAVFFVLAYRFDNRFVLSLALSSLGAWFGFRLARFGLWSEGSMRASGLAYGSLVAGAGAALHRAGLKTHFLETYLHVAANALFATLASGAGTRGDAWPLYMAALLALAAFAIVEGVRFKRFVFVVYGVVYAYAGISSRVLSEMRSATTLFAYLAVSGTIVILALAVLARRFGRDA
jgi:hypothetical protein